MIDLGDGVTAGLLDGHLGIQDGARLDLHEVGDHQPQAYTAQPQHGVLLVHRLDGLQQQLVLGARSVARLGDLDELLFEVGQELMQRRVDEAHHHGQSVHGLEDALEVTLLEDLQLGHGLVEGRDRGGLVGVELLARGSLGPGTHGDRGDEDGVTHDLQPLAFAEHVLGAAETDALGTVAAGAGRFLWLVGVGPDIQAADLVGPAEHGLEVRLLVVVGGHRGEGALEDLAGRAIEADPVALGEGVPNSTLLAVPVA